MIWFGYEFNEVVLSFLIDVYISCIFVDDVRVVFEWMVYKDVVLCSIMIFGLVCFGRLDEVILIFF